VGVEVDGYSTYIGKLMNIQPLSPLFRIAGFIQSKIIGNGLLRWTGNMIYKSDCFDTYPSSGKDSILEYRTLLL